VARYVELVTAIWGDKYSDEYVTALRKQVPGIIVLGRDRPLTQPEKYTHWWCKLSAFAPENRDLRPCLFIDLDTYILGELECFLALDLSKLWLIRDFYKPTTSNSGLFIVPDDILADIIWKNSTRHDMSPRHGDGNYLASYPHKILNDHVSGIRSYKADNLYDDRGDTRICCFHGAPKPHETEGWAQEYWQCMSQ